MTYAFEYKLPNIKEGSEEAEKELQKLKSVSYFVPCFILSSNKETEEGGGGTS
jgi:hypothetical protein